MIKINFHKILNYILTSLIFIVISFVCKYCAMFFINSNIRVYNNVFELFFVKNRGAAFSLFERHTDILIILSWIVLIGIFFYIIKNSARLSNFKTNALAILTAGISGNLYERIYDGYVTDYINFTFINFPVFNVSDIMITIGAVLLIFALYNK